MWVRIADMNCVLKLEEIWWPIVCDCIFLQFINSQVASMCFTIRFTMDVVFWFLIRYDYFFYYFEKWNPSMRGYLIKDSIFNWRGLLQLIFCAELYITMHENNRRKAELQPRGSLLPNTKYFQMKMDEYKMYQIRQKYI